MWQGILPVLNKDVIIHISNLVTPSHYPFGMKVEERRMWTEQYLLEAFLSYNQTLKLYWLIALLKIFIKISS